MDPFTLGLLASLLAGASWSGVCLVSGSVGLTKALQNKMRAMLGQAGPEWSGRILEATSIRAELMHIGTDVGQNRSPWGITAQEEPLFQLLTDGPFQSDLADWLESCHAPQGAACREKLEESMCAALESGGAAPEQAKNFQALYFDLFEYHVFANPVLAFKRIESLITQGPEARRYAEHVTFEAEYLDAIQKEYGYLELLGLPSHAQRHPIDTGFISLSLGCGGGREARPSEQVLRDHPRLVIEGEAGAGKSTLLQWESCHCRDDGLPRAWAQEDIECAHGPKRGGKTRAPLIPFFLKLRRLIEKGQDFPAFPPWESWQDLSTPYFTKVAPQGWLDSLLKEDRLLLLLDGLDELPEEKRPEFWAELGKWLRRYPGLRFRVSSRYFPRKDDKADQWQPPRDPNTGQPVPSFRVEPLSPERIDRLIEQWHDAAVLAEPTEEFSERTRRELEGYADTLKAKIREPRYRRIFELAETPFLCAAICLTNRARRELLPEERHELYKMLIDALIGLRDKERKIQSHKVYDALSPRSLIRVHGLLAWDMMGGMQQEGPGADGEEPAYLIEAGREDVLEWVKGYVGNIPALSGAVDAAGLVNYILTRCGLIHELSGGGLGFRHRALQEYLAGTAAVQSRRIIHLVNHADNDRWHDAIVLAAGGYEVGEPDAIRLIEELVKRGNNEGLEICFTLAVACLDTARDKVDKKTQDLALAKLDGLLPPKNPQDAKVLAAAGNPAVARLAYADFGGKDVEVVAACAEALGRIGSGAARAQLEQGYAADERPAVLHHALRCPGLNPLNMPAIVGNAGQIHTLRFPEIALPHVEDLSPLANLAGLQALDLGDCDKVTDLSPLAGLPGLRSLNLEGCTQVTDLTPLGALRGLRRLTLGDCAGVVDLSPLAGLTGLEFLDLGRCRNLADLSPLSGLPGLRSLNLRSCEKLADLSPLAGLSRLETLELAYCEGVTDLSPLEGLAGLRMLDLQGGREAVQDLKLLKALPAAAPGQDYIELACGVPIKMVWVEGGEFQMGSLDDEEGHRASEGPVQRVVLTGFWMGAELLTQAQYEAVVGSNPSRFKGADRPVERVSWDDAVACCQQLSERCGRVYALPSEAQWEYACRAGSTGRFCFGDSDPRLGHYAWYDANSGRETHGVGGKRPNAWGLYDMHGHVWEWCQDAWHESYNDALDDGSARKAKRGTPRVVRGGSWDSDARDCRSAYRNYLTPDNRYHFVGFRVLTVPSSPGSEG